MFLNVLCRVVGVEVVVARAVEGIAVAMDISRIFHGGGFLGGPRLTRVLSRFLSLCAGQVCVHDRQG